MKQLRIIAIFLAFAAACSGLAAQPVPSDNEHSVIVNFAYGSTDLSKLFDLEDELKNAILEAEAGELDGNEVAVDGSDASLFMYGPNADRLFAVIKPILESTPFMRGAKVLLRYGSQDDSPEKVIVINP